MRFECNQRRQKFDCPRLPYLQWQCVCVGGRGDCFILLGAAAGWGPTPASSSSKGRDAEAPPVCRVQGGETNDTDVSFTCLASGGRCQECGGTMRGSGCRGDLRNLRNLSSPAPLRASRASSSAAAAAALYRQPLPAPLPPPPLNPPPPPPHTHTQG